MIGRLLRRIFFRWWIKRKLNEWSRDEHFKCVLEMTAYKFDAVDFRVWVNNCMAIEKGEANVLRYKRWDDLKKELTDNGEWQEE